MFRFTTRPIAAMFVLALAGAGLTGEAMAQMRGSVPQPGDPIPSVAGFDADGNPLALTKLQGKHTVIVFGCLT